MKTKLPCQKCKKPQDFNLPATTVLEQVIRKNCKHCGFPNDWKIRPPKDYTVRLNKEGLNFILRFIQEANKRYKQDLTIEEGLNLLLVEIDEQSKK